MSDNKINIYKPLCVVLAATTIFSFKGNLDNTKEVSTLKSDISELSEDYRSLEAQYDTLVDQQISSESEVVASEQSGSAQSSQYAHNVTPIYPDVTTQNTILPGTVYVWRISGSTEVYHTSRDCYHIRDKADSDVLTITIDEAEQEGLRKCSHCKPLY